ncbi:MAG: hypothetical protein JNM46_01205, partial [Anaerolineales bacterium]|nr:hypothetical protein [Anaerolineales bacterium]
MRLIRFLLLFIFLISLAPMPVHAQTPTPPAAVRLLIDGMTPEEKVGQLFLVSFSGTDTSETSQIYNLITQYHVGGVVLTAGNDNFTSTDTLVQTHALINDLQRVEWNNSLGNTAYAPLFVGIAQEGDGYPTDQILNGLTP